MRGLSKVQQQCLLAAIAQNIKKIALMLSRTAPNTPLSALLALLQAYTNQFNLYLDFSETSPTAD